MVDGLAISCASKQGRNWDADFGEERNGCAADLQGNESVMTQICGPAGNVFLEIGLTDWLYA